MPSTPGCQLPVAQNNRRGVGQAPIGNFGFGLQDDFALNVLTFAILRIQFSRQRTRLDRIGSQEKTQRFLSSC